MFVFLTHFTQYYYWHDKLDKSPRTYFCMALLFASRIVWIDIYTWCLTKSCHLYFLHRHSCGNSCCDVTNL